MQVQCDFKKPDYNLPGPSRGGKAGQFSPAPRRFFVGGGAPSLKNTEKGVLYGFFLTSNMYKIHFRPYCALNPAGGAYDAPSDP